MTDIATGNAAAVFFQRGQMLAQWLDSKESYRWITDEECRHEFKISRDQWMKCWRGEEGKKKS